MVDDTRWNLVVVCLVMTAWTHSMTPVLRCTLASALLAIVTLTSISADAASLIFLELPNEPQTTENSPGWIGRPHMAPQQVKKRFEHIERRVIPHVVQHGTKLKTAPDLKDYVRPLPLPIAISICSWGPSRSAFWAQLDESTIAYVFPGPPDLTTPSVAIYFRMDDELSLDKGGEHRLAWEEKKMATLLKWIESLPGNEPVKPKEDRFESDR